MSDAYWLTAKEASRRIREGRLSSVDLVAACLERIAARDPTVRAFVHLDPEAALAQARSADSRPSNRPLHGVPFAVKDVLDTAGVPTQYGSPIWSGYMPRADAAAVALTLRAGGVMIGKSVSTEFASMFPGPTTHPMNPLHTPGGSSSGSAAGVADGFFPIAFGTQTAGSIIRPAAYCGIVGYKPTYGTLHRAGMKVMSESLDTIGALARSVADCALFIEAAAGIDLGDPDVKIERAPRLAVCMGAPQKFVSAELAEFLECAARTVESKGAVVTALELPPEAVAAFEGHPAVVNGEALQALAWERNTAPGQISRALNDRLDWGAGLTSEVIAEGRAAFAAGREAFARIFENCDAILAPSAPGEAPNGLAATGDPVFNLLWTAMYGPCVTVPVGFGSHGLPLGIQLVGAPGRDRQTLAIAEWVRAAMN